MIKPDVKIPKILDRKGFSSSVQLDIPGMFYVYKIAIETMLGRRDSSASVSSITSVASIQSSFSFDEQLPFRKNSRRRRMSEDIPSDATSLDFVHPLTVAETTEGLATFTLSSSPPDEGDVGGGSRKKFAARRKMLVISADPLVESVFETPGLSDGVGSSGRLSILDAVDLENSVCSSPDSGVVQDEFSVSSSSSICPTLRVKNGRVGMPNGHTFIHSMSSPSILRDDGAQLPCT